MHLVSSLARRARRRCAIALLAGVPALALAQSPAGLSFVAQDGGGAWSLYRIDERAQPRRVATELEPRQACLTPDGRKGVYAAADGTLRLIGAGGSRETVLARPDAKRSFTQPCLGADGNEVVAVEMADGKSLETEILRFAAGAEPQAIARQPGAQHDPYLHAGRWLVYASVGCSDGCGQLLVEIWARDLIGGQARQLTLLNALSQNPVTDGRRVVFSSNAGGSHQLWQVGLDGSGLRRLTNGAGQAILPALCGGALYYVKAGPSGAAIARLGTDGVSVELQLPGLKSFRALRCVS